MERLTDPEQVNCIGLSVCGGGCDSCPANNPYYKSLAKYENTGLTPDEIERLQSENAQLRERLDRAVEGIEHSCRMCAYTRDDGGCKLLPDGDAYSIDYTDGFDRDYCENWQWRGLERSGE